MEALLKKVDLIVAANVEVQTLLTLLHQQQLKVEQDQQFVLKTVALTHALQESSKTCDIDKNLIHRALARQVLQHSHRTGRRLQSLARLQQVQLQQLKVPGFFVTTNKKELLKQQKILNHLKSSFPHLFNVQSKSSDN